MVGTITIYVGNHCPSNLPNQRQLARHFYFNIFTIANFCAKERKKRGKILKILLVLVDSELA